MSGTARGIIETALSAGASLMALVRGRDRHPPLDLASSQGSGRIGEPTVPAAVSLASLAVNLVALTLPLLVLQVYDRIIPREALTTLGTLLAGFAVILALDTVLRILRARLSGLGAMAFGRRALAEAMRRLLAAPYGKVEAEPSAVHMARIAAIGQIAAFHLGQSRLIGIDLAFTLVFFTLMALIGGVLALVPPSLFLVFAAIAAARTRRTKELTQERNLKEARKYDFVMEVLEGISTVKSFSMEAFLQRRYERLHQGISALTRQLLLLSNHGHAASVLLGSLTQAGVISLGAILVAGDALSMGALACCSLLSGQVIQPLLKAIAAWNELESLSLKRQEASSLFEAYEPAATIAIARDLEGAIRAEDASFSYGSSEVLRHLSFAVPPGALVGIRGGDGSGRSTLLRLLRGDLLPTSGRITIGGVCTWSLAARRERAACIFVAQRPQIFHGTILDNLTMFQGVALHAAAREAAALTGLDREVHLLPGGYETMIGDTINHALPESLLQQICIARAIAFRPRILILDEANTCLDARGETQLALALRALAGRMTVLLATHRPSLLRAMDLVLECKDATVTASAAAPSPIAPQAPAEVA